MVNSPAVFPIEETFLVPEKCLNGIRQGLVPSIDSAWFLKNILN